jgi:regulator of sigma E protease
MAFLIFIGLLVSLILVHELGHFAVAKFFGIRVDEFGIFFPPRIAAVKLGETEYSLNWLPFGGFVKIFGENNEQGPRSPDASVGAPTSQEERRSFSAKHRLVQAAVIVAGIVMNILFAWLIVSVGYMAGLPTSKDHEGFGTVRNAQTMVVGVLPSSPADKSGITAQDVITGISTANASLTAPFDAEGMRMFIADHQDDSMILNVMRAGAQKTFVVRAAEGLAPDRKALGVELNDVGILQLSPPLALAQGAVLTYDLTRSTASGLGTFFSSLAGGKANFSEVAGPIGIVGIGAGAVKEGFTAALMLTAIISINLAIINIIPIPGLDGGRLLIIAIEGILRRPVSPRVVLWLTIGGFAFLIGLMVVVSYFDVVRLIG